MMDKERIVVLMALLNDYLKELELKMRDTTLEKYNEDLDLRRIVERLIQLISEAELDLAEEVYKGLELKLSAEEKSMLESLTDALGKSIISKLIARRNLRNQLVHAYTSYKNEEVFEKAKDTSDIAAFEAAIKRLLK